MESWVRKELDLRTVVSKRLGSWGGKEREESPEFRGKTDLGYRV